MNFKTLTTGGKTFTPADQAAAFEAYIQQDAYLSSHRGQYAQRGAVFYPIVKRLDLSLAQDLFHDLGGHRHSGQIRLDITNFGNLLNHNWGVGQSMIQNRILTSPRSTRRAALTYNLATVSTAAGPALISHDVPDDGRHQRRLRDDAQLPLHVPVSGRAQGSAEARGERSPRAFFIARGRLPAVGPNVGRQ